MLYAEIPMPAASTLMKMLSNGYFILHICLNCCRIPFSLLPILFVLTLSRLLLYPPNPLSVFLPKEFLFFWDSVLSSSYKNTKTSRQLALAGSTCQTE
jgi:hypothetical protein